MVNNFTIFFYSYLNAFTGLLRAAFHEINVIVIIEVRIVIIPANAKIQQFYFRISIFFLRYYI